MRLSITKRQSNDVIRLCQLHVRHPSLVTWHPELLWNTITFLLSQCAGDHRSHFVSTAVPLAELATTMNIYPPLTDVKHSRQGLLYLWDFMSQAEILTLLCVFLRLVHRQLGPSHVKLDFRIVASRRPSDMRPALSVSAVEPGVFQQRVEHALVDNLRLSPADFRRTGTNEWWVMIEDVASVVEQLPIDSRPTVPADRPRKSSADSRKSSSLSSSSDSWATPKRKVLLATPPAVPATVSDKVQRSNVVSRSTPLTTSSESRESTLPLLRTNRRDFRGALPAHPVTSHVQLQSPAVHRLVTLPRSAVVSVATSVADFTMARTRHNSALPMSVACFSVPPPNYRVSSSLQLPAAPPQNLMSPGGPVQMVMPVAYSSIPSASTPLISPANVPGAVTIAPPLLSQTVAFSSVAFPCYTTAAPPPVTVSASFPSTWYTAYYQQPPTMQLPALASPALPPCRMTAAGQFSLTPLV